MISCMVTAQLICAFVFAYAKGRLSYDVAQLLSILHKNVISEVLLMNTYNVGFHGELSTVICYRKKTP